MCQKFRDFEEHIELLEYLEDGENRFDDQKRQIEEY